MEAEWDVILHQRVGELEQIKDGHVASLHFPLLFPHGELDGHLAVRYQGDSTSHNNKKQFHVIIFLAYGLCIKSSGYSMLHRAARLYVGVQGYMWARFPYRNAYALFARVTGRQYTCSYGWYS